MNACQRGWEGGSPTAVVVDDTPLSDSERRAIPIAAGTSHAVFISAESSPEVSLRFFTVAGELPACGHGTVAALAVLAERAGQPTYEATLRSGGRMYRGHATGDRGRFQAAFNPGPVELRPAAVGESVPIMDALGFEAEADLCVAALERPRVLVQLPDRETLASLKPDLDRLREACDQLRFVGCYVYSTPGPDGRLAARMFAPSIGVPEDMANANSTACLAVHLFGRGLSVLQVDMGDSLARPATIRTTIGTGRRVWVGGCATIPFDAEKVHLGDGEIK
ncbi:PhzF family phenazine biosynthesis protein [Kribbella sp. VKM Ac-2566]|uniref:PhzF family phenazine biosynthesis protein n=1 Tax=Kribbella sp. VKM Ac-2566 TaxID=2512218 RepID=UPI002107065F|nr:PhzF family phenazine biosynthesis isomerase [Kribbella sp. VKM Ac-2566]